MKLNKPAVWASLLSLFLVVWFVWRDAQQISPGPLAAAHAADPELDEQDCAACHGEDTGDRSGMAAACAQCHAEIGEQLAQRRGLHGLLPDSAVRCGACHSEHHGPLFALVSQASFARAGIADAAHYDHAGLGYELSGRHLGLDCLECHENSDATLLAKGKRRFLGESQACASCHADPHGGRLPDCKSCHGEERPFAEAPLFRHAESFPLTGAHAGLACVRCHSEPGQYAGAARDCAACHASPHAEGFLAGAASCESCHPIQARGFARDGTVFPRERHASSGFALSAPHDRQECAQCHAPGLDYRAAHPGRKLEDCAACHADVHRGQFGARGCRECHAGETWKPALYGVAEHANSAFPLEQAHATTKCGDCHQESSGLRRFAGTPLECAACHADAHEGSFADSAGCQECHQADSFASAAKAFDHLRWTGFAVDGAHERAGCASCHPGSARARGRACAACHADAHRGFFGDSRDCDECHGTDDFARTREPFDHGSRTGFALVGAHASRECAICHVPAAVEDAAGRSFGFAKVAATAAAKSCTSCHADPHRGAFAEPAQGCIECHTQVAWSAASAGFDHQRWTGFALEGRHAEAGCRSCHPELARAAGKRCSDCHADPHAGQFAQRGADSCARCHVSATSFHELAFDHQRDSRFPLDATHKDVACAKCHVRWPLRGGGSAVRYRPLGLECGDCHDTRR